jgi:integrase
MGGRITPVRLAYVDRIKDRYGRVHVYFRRGKTARVALPAESDPGFMYAYSMALAASQKPAPRKEDDRSFNALLKLYFSSPDFRGTKPQSQVQTRRILERFAKDHGHRLVAQMRRENVVKIVGERVETPAAANNLLRKLRAVMGFAIVNGWRTDDPTAKVKKFPEGTHHTWNEAEIARFEARWPHGTVQRIAFALALYTGQRRGDVAAMTWADYADGMITVAQEKTDAERNDVRMVIPAHSGLVEALDAWRAYAAANGRLHLVIVSTTTGKGYAKESLGNYMSEAFTEAGLPDRCVLHGLRKAAARRLAEAGCSAHMIQSITGHASLKEVERYTKAVAQGRLAGAAIELLEAHRKQ